MNKLKIYYNRTYDVYEWYLNFITILNLEIKLIMYEMSQLSQFFITMMLLTKLFVQIWEND